MKNQIPLIEAALKMILIFYKCNLAISILVFERIQYRAESLCKCKSHSAHMNNNVTHAVSQESVEFIYNIIQITK